MTAVCGDALLLCVVMHCCCVWWCTVAVCGDALLLCVVMHCCCVLYIYYFAYTIVCWEYYCGNYCVVIIVAIYLLSTTQPCHINGYIPSIIQLYSSVVCGDILLLYTKVL